MKNKIFNGLLFLLVFYSSFLFAHTKIIGSYVQYEKGLNEIDIEGKNSIVLFDNIIVNINRTPEQYSQKMDIFFTENGKEIYTSSGIFWLYFRKNNFPCDSCQSVIFREKAEGHYSDSFWVVTKYPDGEVSLYIISNIWDELSVDLLKSENKIYYIQLIYGSYLGCTDRIYVNRAAIFDLATRDWRLDKSKEIPLFYKNKIGGIDTDKVYSSLAALKDSESNPLSYSIYGEIFKYYYYNLFLDKSLSEINGTLSNDIKLRKNEEKCIKEIVDETTEIVKKDKISSQLFFTKYTIKKAL